VKWQRPFSSGVSWREPRRAQIPKLTERKPGISSLRMVSPLLNRVVFTASDK
jgi:hypothetical protein